MDQQGPLESYKTVREAAEFLMITRQAVIKAIKSGHIKAGRKGNLYLIPIEQLKEYQNSPVRNPQTRGSLGGRPKQN